MALETMSKVRLSSTGRLIAVGEFYEKLCANLLGGERDTNQTSSQQGDVHHFGLDATIEVKGTSNRDSARIAISQLESHLKNAGFPCTHCWYFIASYQNHARSGLSCRARPRGYPHQRLLTNKSYTEDKGVDFLKQQTDFACLIDAKILQRYPRMHETVLRRHGDGFAETIPFGRRYARELATNGELGYLGFRSKRFETRQYLVQPQGEYAGMRLNLIAILPPANLDEVEAELHAHAIIERL